VKRVESWHHNCKIDAIMAPRPTGCDRYRAERGDAVNWFLS